MDTFDNWVLNASFILNELLFIWELLTTTNSGKKKKNNSETKQNYHRMTIFKELHIGIRERRLPLLLLSLLPSLLQLIRAYKDMHKAKELIVSTRICWTLEQLAVHLEWCQEKSLQSFLVWNLLSWHLLPVRSWVTYLFSLSLNFLNRKKKKKTHENDTLLS